MKAHFLVHDKFEETKYEVMSTEEMSRQFLYVRLNTVLPLSCEATIDGVKNVMQNKRKKVSANDNVKILKFDILAKFIVNLLSYKFSLAYFSVFINR